MKTLRGLRGMRGLELEAVRRGYELRTVGLLENAVQARRAGLRESTRAAGGERR